ncbi:MAG: alanine racemase [Candidatus Lokiarchaeota archaeon]|nr:alanine racemase [Candidatus Lokiarchaeota archaeon]
MDDNWKSDISTPALVLNYDTMLKNIKTMAKFVKDTDVNLRPHLKTAKMPIIAHMILKEGGANGIAVAKVGEAEIFAQSGIDDILIANQVIDIEHIKRLVMLNRYVLVRCAVDSKKNILDLSKHATKKNIELEVLLEIDLGLGRAGVDPGEPALELAKFIRDTPGVNLVGLQGYEGHLTPMMNIEQREIMTRECMNWLNETKNLLNENGFSIDYISTSGSATYMHAAMCDGITEVQPGTYVFSDEHLFRVNPIFDIAVTVLSTVQNQTGNKEFTLDAGTKAIAIGDGKPVVRGFPKIKFRVMNEEHTQLKSFGAELQIGQKIELIPAHICPTLNLYDYIHVIKNNEFSGKWQIFARGKNY